MHSYKKGLKSFNALVEALEQIPTIGKKSALKMAYTLGVENKFLGIKIAHCIENAIHNVRKCSFCNALSENELCEICSDTSRDNSQLCFVLHSRDIFSIEETKEYNGIYYVLENLEELDFEKLKKAIMQRGVKEIIFAFTPTLANEGIMLFIEDKLQNLSLHFSKIAQGVPTGIGLENIDQLSLSRAIISRIKI
ncbi:recombination protein RecR [Helicobacter anseris]|uniref:Recombination protein RecR n=1 Tax=Helicobacter anseris TaxID=375926 RepID=A0A3D8J445_9HELI|nr:recombination mediator RecR [Helicobacter anseris]RDU72010.1 recombination protein RecR [Helicobacter anseris]